MKHIITLLLCLTLLSAASGCSEPTQNLPVTTTAVTTAATTTAATTAATTATATTAATTAATTVAVTTLPTTAATTTAATTATTTATTAATPPPAETGDSPADDDVREIDGSWIEACDPFDEQSAVRFAEKLQSIRTIYPSSEAVLALIPDKSYYAIDTLDDKALDHTAMTTVVAQELSGWSMVELHDLYTWDDFYRTDLHWRQEVLMETAKRLGHALGITIDEAGFTETNLGAFRGIYADYAPDAAEELIVLEHPDFADVTVEHYEKSCTTVYDLDMVDSGNSYDTFLSGASPLTVITNPNAESGTSLLVFRDSFASSLVPLLIPSYETITLVDLRYMHSSLLGQFVPDTDGDILFLYSARVVNNSAMLR